MIPTIVVLFFNVIIVASMVLCLARMVWGPTAADRMVAIDLLGLLVALLMVSHSIQTGDEAIIDVVLVFSVIAFFGTVALARYLQRLADGASQK